jgi:sugar-specific transcriptional regulator TrmB
MALEIIKNLQKLGFTENEAKIYTSLVCLKTATAREIYETSRVPRPKVYKVLKGMTEKGYVHVTEEEPAHFSCIPPEELISRLKADFMFSLNETFYGLHALSLEEILSAEKSLKIEMKC